MRASAAPGLRRRRKSEVIGDDRHTIVLVHADEARDLGGALRRQIVHRVFSLPDQEAVSQRIVTVEHPGRLAANMRAA